MCVLDLIVSLNINCSKVTKHHLVITSFICLLVFWKKANKKIIKLPQHKAVECKTLKYWILTLEMQDMEILKFFNGEKLWIETQGGYSAKYKLFLLSFPMMYGATQPRIEHT